MVPDTVTATLRGGSPGRGGNGNDPIGAITQASGTVSGMKLPIVAAAAVLLSACSPQPSASRQACLEITGVTGSVAQEAVRVPGGMLLLRGADLVFDNGGAERVVARDVHELYTVATIDGDVVVVYRGADDGESSPLITHDVTTGEETELGVASTFEYAVTQVAYDAGQRAWIVTAQSDLSETFTVISLDGQGGDGVVHAPYEYNAGPYLAAVVPGKSTSYLALEAPEGSVNAWSVARLGQDGKVVERQTWPAGLGLPDGVVDTLTGAGMYVHTVDGRDAVVLENGGEIQVVAACAPARGRWLSRQ